MGGWLRGLAVVAGESAAGIGMIFTDLVDFLGGLTDSTTDTKALLEQYPALYRLIGEEAASAMAEVGATDGQVQSVRALASETQALAGEAQGLSSALAGAAREAEFFERDQAANAFRLIAAAIDANIHAFDQGAISADDFAARLDALRAQAEAVLTPLEGIDGADFDAVQARLGGLVGALQNVWAAASAAAGQVAALSADGIPPVTGPAGAPAGVTVPPPPPVAPGRPEVRPTGPDMDGDGIPDHLQAPVVVGGGSAPGGGSGAAAQASAYEAALASLRAEITSLNIETATYQEAVGTNLPNALEYARTRAELLTAAQEDGREITPELAAEIDALALSYANAGQAAEDAADRLQAIQDNAKRGADAIAGLFAAAGDGADAARRAVGNLLAQIAQAQLMKGLQALAGMNGGNNVFAVLGSLLSFDGGGYTGDAPRSGGLDGKGGQLAMLHPRETVIDHTKGQTAGGASQVNVHVTASVDESGHLNIRQIATQAAAQMGRAVSAAVPGQIRQYQQSGGRRT